MTTLTMRSFKGEADLEPLVDLINACAAAVAEPGEGTSLAELRQALAHPDLDITRDVRLWEDAFGLAAYAEASLHKGIHPDVRLRFSVRPDARGQGLEEQVIAWSFERTHEARQTHGIRFVLGTDANDQDSERVALLERRGFRPVRYFLRLSRLLDSELPEPQLPPGFSLRQVRGEEDIEPWTEMFNQSFVDHWNFEPITAADLRYYNNAPSYRADLDQLATAPDGVYAAFCYAEYNQQVNARSGRNEGFIAVLGTRRGYRKLGLGKAMLLASMHRLQAFGADSVALVVDAENPSGATRLYEATGFRPIRTRVIYVHDVE